MENLDFIQEGKEATQHTLGVYSEAHSVIANLLAELSTHGNYVPETLPAQDETVLLAVVKDANTLTAKSLFQSEPEITIALAQHTGESIRDWEEGYFSDDWRLSSSCIHIIDCAKDAVYWLPLPNSWQQAKFIGYGIPFTALTSLTPIFNLLCIKNPDDADAVTTPQLGQSICLRLPSEWLLQEQHHG